MHILFITANRLGDAVLSTGILGHLLDQHPDAAVTVACGALPAPLFARAPGVAEVIVLEKQPLAGHWRKLWGKVWRQRWDLVVDLRHTPLIWGLRARRRLVRRGGGPVRHKVAELGDLLGLDPPPAPRLWLTPADRAAARALIPDGSPVLGVGPAANWRGKTWRAECFNQSLARLLPGLPPGTRVAIFAGPGEAAAARPVLDSLPPGIGLDLIGKGDPALSAACLARCDLYFGNDSGLMHMAAAMGVPTLGLFGPSKPEIYAPFGPHGAHVATPETMEDFIARPGYDHRTTDTLMDSLSVDTVVAAVQALWADSHRSRAHG